MDGWIVDDGCRIDAERVVYDQKKEGGGVGWRGGWTGAAERGIGWKAASSNLKALGCFALSPGRPAVGMGSLRQLAVDTAFSAAGREVWIAPLLDRAAGRSLPTVWILQVWVLRRHWAGIGQTLDRALDGGHSRDSPLSHGLHSSHCHWLASSSFPIPTCLGHSAAAG